MKINTICFIILLFLLIGVASAAEIDNETSKQSIEQPQDTISPMNLENQEKLEATNNEKLELHVNSTAKLEKSKTVVAVLTKAKSTKTKITISAPNVKMYYNDGSKFTVTLKNSAKKVIKNAKVKITICTKTYVKTTNNKGQVSLSIKLNAGQYPVQTIYDGSKKYYSQFVKSTITVKSTIKSSRLSKYYKNTAPYSSTFYDKKGKVLKNTKVKINLNGHKYTVKTNKNGVAKLAVDMNPGYYCISLTNPKTSETISHLIEIKSILETKDLTMKESDGSKFTVKVLDSNGNAASNKKVTLKVNGKTYTPVSNLNGIATQTIDLSEGKYVITTEYEGLVNTNVITVIEGIKHSPFSHITSVPNYVNVTYPYVFHNSAYALKTGFDGIIRMPKNELFTIQISSTQGYLFSQAEIPGVSTTVIGYKTHLIPFDGSGIKSDYNKNNLKGNGILIYTTTNHTNIEYRNTAETNNDLFGIYIDKGLDHSETITYVQNNQIKAKVNFYTVNYDEMGLKYNLGKFHGISIYDFNYKSYEDLIGGSVQNIKFANTGEAVTFSYFGKTITGYTSKEDIITRFIINGKEELEKAETISYGLGEKYRNTMGFEVLQSYAIINEKITKDILEKWVNKNSGYLNKFGIMNVYGMFLASLETAWLADEIADQYAKDLNVKWNRDHTVTILGGINLDDTYIHILNADMGMEVSGDEKNTKIFRMMNSFYLPNIENYVLKPVSNRYGANETNSIDNLLNSVTNNTFSIVQIGEIFYILDEINNSTIVINSTSGVADVILIEKDFAYKGSKIQTAHDCCSVGSTPQDILKGIMDTLNKFKTLGGDVINNIMNKIHPIATLLYDAGNIGLAVAGKLAPSASTGLASTIGLILQVHTIGNHAKNNFMDENSWHWAYKHLTFTRDSPLESKKFFNIPNSDGTYDYIEVKIKSDGSLDRNDALYIGDGYSRKLTKNETYKYFTEEKWK